jgi:hypothetical protein
MTAPSQIRTEMKTKSPLARRYSLRRLADRCVGKRDRECLFRLAKEVAVIDQDFESATALIQLQKANKPNRPVRKVRRG